MALFSLDMIRLNLGDFWWFLFGPSDASNKRSHALLHIIACSSKILANLGKQRRRTVFDIGRSGLCRGMNRLGNPIVGYWAGFGLGLLLDFSEGILIRFGNWGLRWRRRRRILWGLDAVGLGGVRRCCREVRGAKLGGMNVALGLVGRTNDLSCLWSLWEESIGLID